MPDEFDVIVEAVLGKMAAKKTSRIYNWDKVFDYLKNHKFVTARKVRALVGCSNPQQVYQWLQRHVAIEIDLNLRTKEILDEKQRLVKIKGGNAVVYALKSTVEQIIAKAQKQE